MSNARSGVADGLRPSRLTSASEQAMADPQPAFLFSRCLRIAAGGELIPRTNHLSPLRAGLQLNLMFPDQSTDVTM
jgi:hypothetical protein